MMRVCPGCTSERSLTFGTKSGLVVKQCARCATLYSDSAPAAEDFYDDYYAHTDVPEFFNLRLDQIVGRFSRYRQSNRLLDVGFGAGSMLDAAARAGWDVHGVEVSGRAVEDVTRRHSNVRKATLAEARYPDAHFDVVLASELLEHLEDPAGFAREVMRILRPKGLLWATTPHARGIAARVLKMEWSVISPADHLQLFSIRGVRMLMARAGFRRTHIDTHGADPTEIARALRQKIQPRKAAEPFNRVESLQPLNRIFIQTRSGSAAKKVINGILNAGRLGDSLKIFAEA